MKLLDKIFGDPNEKTLKEINFIVDKINGLEGKYKSMSDDELKAMTGKFKEDLGAGTKTDEEIKKRLDEMLPEVFAVCREASRRVLKKRHFDEQLIGGVVLHRGQIAEMKTGEGKTLVAMLPLYLNSLAGKGCHLVTVNDYLSRVGAGLNAPLCHFLGLSVGVIVHEAAYTYDPEVVDDSQYDESLKHFKKIARNEAYNCDITYGTNNEYGFDYLRDNMVPTLDKMAQRDLYYAIIDEVDSILIDEARTPLIISAPAEASTEKYYNFAQLVNRLNEDEDYNVDEKMRAVTLSEEGIAKMEKMLGVDNIYVTGGIRDVHHIEQALKARVLFTRDKDYVIKDGEIIIVDEFTGRLMPGRRYSEGLHQAIEAKEGVEIQRESQTLATVTFQNFFRMYDKLAGMTGTAVTEAEEFSKIYNLETVVVPTHRPVIRKDLNDLIYKTEDGKYKAVIKEVKERNRKGQSVLIGTISIEKNELLSRMMEREGLEPQILNAKNHQKEAKIISQAGKPGAITIATNMAGRGVDIILGGNPPIEEDQKKVKEAGGLHVIGTERHESRRIDNQLRGRSGRLGDPGSTQFYVSMEDDLMRIFGGDRMKSLMTTLRVPEDMPIENRMISRSIESAQKKVEGNNFDTRKHLVEYDDVINKHREAIYRRRREVLAFYEEDKKREEESEIDYSEGLSGIILDMIEAELEQVVIFHTGVEDVKEWNLKEIYQVTATIFPVEEKLKEDLSTFIQGGEKLDKAEARTKIIEHLFELAKNKYKELAGAVKDLDVLFCEVEKAVAIRSIDSLWIEHIEAMAHMRQGIGLRGYGQRDPLIEYKKEAYGMYNELNNLIHRQIVYSIYKVGSTGMFRAPSLSDRATNFSAPSKTMDSSSSSFSGYKKQGEQKEAVDLVKPKMKNDSGEKVGRNDPCPCGSGKKYKKCHG